MPKPITIDADGRQIESSQFGNANYWSYFGQIENISAPTGYQYILPLKTSIDISHIESFWTITATNSASNYWRASIWTRTISSGWVRGWHLSHSTQNQASSDSIEINQTQTPLFLDQSRINAMAMMIERVGSPPGSTSFRFRMRCFDYF